MTHSTPGADFHPEVHTRPRLPTRALDAVQRAMLKCVCELPKLTPLATGVRFSVAPGMQVPFVAHAGEVVLSPPVLREYRCAAVTLRHALELAQWRRSCPDPRSFALHVANGVLACRAAAPFARRHGLQGAQAATMPGWLAQLSLVLSEPIVSRAVLLSLAEHTHELLQLQGFVCSAPPDAITQAWAHVADIVEGALPVAVPLEQILTTGGDSRLRVYRENGLNGYGCSPSPRPWAITFATTTATCISSRAYAEVHESLQDLRSHALNGDLDSAAAGTSARIRQGITHVCGISSDTEIVLTASGTDAELCALYLSLLASNAPLVNVVIGPQETGSSVMLAAAGQHYDTQSPLGVIVPRGTPLDPFYLGRVQALGIELREDNGQLRPEAAVETEIESTVARAVAEGRRVLLHVLDASKTGLVAPQPAYAADLKRRYGDALDVVVDACQLRLCPETLRAYCDAGFMILVSGSKFLAGPPFAGALLVPQVLAQRAVGAASLPEGLRSYTTRDQWPLAWQALRDSIPTHPNLGLLLRWQAALCEAVAFRSLDSAQVRRVLLHCGNQVKAAIESRPYLKLLPVRPIRRASFGSADRWDEIQTIFTFAVRLGAKEAHADDASRIYRWLNQDIAARLPASASAAERRVAARVCHIGQPVAVTAGSPSPVVGLRLALGARLVSEICSGGADSATFDDRLDHATSDILTIFRKLDAITQNYAHLAEQGANPAADNAYAYPPVTPRTASHAPSASLDSHDCHELLADCL